MKVLAGGPHTVRDKVIDPKRAKSRPICKKIFVGGVDATLTEDDIRKYFSRYGKIEGVELPFDRNRGKRREFCFIIFEEEMAADAATKEAKQTVGNRECDVKKAQPQPVAQQQKRMNSQNPQEGGRPHGGSSRGGRGGSRNGGSGDGYTQSYGSDSYGSGSYGQTGYGNYGAQGYSGYGQSYPGYSSSSGYGSQYDQYYNQYYGTSYEQYWNQYYAQAGYGQTAGATADGSGDWSASQATQDQSGSTGGKISSKSGPGRGSTPGYHPYGGRGSQSSH